MRAQHGVSTALAPTFFTGRPGGDDEGLACGGGGFGRRGATATVMPGGGAAASSRQRAVSLPAAGRSYEEAPVEKYAGAEGFGGAVL